MQKAIELLKTELEEVEIDIKQLQHEAQAAEDAFVTASNENKLNLAAQREMADHLRQAIDKLENP